ncbi:hypothetical protein EDD21DRAFT_191815 [Dissophora ornata]|nr:hypothetical protein EDD21DRAFT_191815 [Dissophora ornata]
MFDNNELRKILKFAKVTSKTKLTISLETPTKKFSAWTFKDVCAEYYLSDAFDPGFEAISPFTDIQAATLDTEFQTKICDGLIAEVDSRVHVLKLFGANAPTRSMVVASFLIAATRLFVEDFYLVAQRDISGRRGNGLADFSIQSPKNSNVILVVTQVRRDDFRQGVAENLVLLESVLTGKKRKRQTYEIDGEEKPSRKARSYGIVTDASNWVFIECTMHEDETVSYRMTQLNELLNFENRWQDEAKMVLRKLAWLWSRMRDEILAREN